MTPQLIHRLDGMDLRIVKHVAMMRHRQMEDAAMAHEAPETLLESKDGGRIIGLTPAGFSALVNRGEIHPVAVTPRGLRLFRPADVEKLRRVRQANAERRSSRA